MTIFTLYQSDPVLRECGIGRVVPRAGGGRVSHSSDSSPSAWQAEKKGEGSL